jgi:hypothetical protein
MAFKITSLDDYSAPDGFFTSATAGDPDNTNIDSGSVTLTQPSKYPPDHWWIVAEGCDWTNPVLHLLHKCNTNVFPQLSLTMMPWPRKPFSCASKLDKTGALVLEVGSCDESDYGLRLYIVSRPCTQQMECPEGTSTFGFAIAAPAHGITSDEFVDLIRPKVAAASLRPRETPITLTIPTAQRTTATPSEPRVHYVTFRWVMPDGAAAIVADTSPAWSTDIAPIGTSIAAWPLAAGGVTTPGWGSTQMIRSSGNGCVTIQAPPTPSGRPPDGLVVDLRDAMAPSIAGVSAAKLSTIC